MTCGTMRNCANVDSHTVLTKNSAKNQQIVVGSFPIKEKRLHVER